MNLDAMLRLIGVSKRYGGLVAVDDVTLAFSWEEISAVIGSNGAGKTTLFSLIAGTTVPSRGRILFHGQDITGISPHRICRLGIGRTFQVVRPFRALTVRAHLRAASLFGRKYPLTEQEVAELLDLTQLGRWATDPASTLNLAGCKRLEIARALATGATLLLLDEAIAGLTPEETLQAIELIRNIRESGRTVLLIEHVLSAVKSLCQRVIVMDYGEVIADGPPEQVLASEVVRVAYLGE